MSRVFVSGVWVHTADEAIDRYRPRFAAEPWFTDAHPTLISWVRQAQPQNPTAAYRYILSTCYFARFGARNDLPIDAETLFTPENVDWYTSTALADHGEHSRSTQRAALREVGRAITRRAGWKSPEPQFQKPATAEPYSSAQRADLMGLVDLQPSPGLTRLMSGMLACGFGAGLRGPEMERVTAADVERRGPLVALHIMGPRARTVPVRRQDAETILRLAFDHPDEPLLGPFKPHQRDPVSRAKRRLDLPPWAPPLETRRLRATWMVDVLNEDIQLSTFAAAAGITDLRFAGLLPHLKTRKDPEVVAATLAGYSS
ncbi:hypothetical protein ACO0E1_00830 [Curtobacterium sp. RRHDQ66]|uniref:hypothetical protein n=1 Tax=Curtobacterium guangdongense TaxID=3413380 RepID=UPI003BF112F2